MRSREAAPLSTASGSEFAASFTLDSEWRFTFLDAGAADLFGATEADLLDEVIWDAVPESSLRAPLTEAREERTTVTFDATVGEHAEEVTGHAQPSNGGVSVSLRRAAYDGIGQHRRDTLLESVSDVVVTIDETSTVRDVNRAVRDVFGYEPEELVGEQVTELMPEGLADRHLESFRRYVEEGDRNLDWEYFEFTGVGTEGEEIELAMSINEREGGDGQLFTGVIRDITGRKHRETELEEQRDLAKRRQAELESLVGIGSTVMDVSRALLDARSQPEISSRVCDRLASADHWCAAWIIDAKARGTVPAHAATGIDEAALAEIATAGSGGPRTSPIAQALEYGRAEVVQNVTEASGDPLHRVLAGEGIRSCVAIPLGSDQETHGALVVCSERPHAFTGTERELLTGLGETVVDSYETVANREKYRSIVDDALDGAESVGVVVLDADYEVVLVSEPIEQFFGLDRSELTGVRMPDIVENHLTGRLDDASIDRLLESYETGQMEQFECYVPGDDVHAERWLEHRSRPIASGHYACGRVEFYYDITERKRHERELERYDAIVDSVGDAVFRIDTDGALRTINDAMVDITGYERSELVGAPMSELLTEGSLERATDAIEWLLESDEEITQVEVETRTADDETIPVECRITTLERDGEFAGTVGVARDVSTRVEREQELERQRDELRRLNRINATIRDVLSSLIDADSRREVDREVCKRLAETGAYKFVWVGGPDPSGDEIEIRDYAGETNGYVEALTIPIGGAADRKGPTAKCMETHEVHTVRDVGDDEFEPWRAEAEAAGVRSTAAVPIVFDGICYGSIGVYAPEPDSFDRREQDILAELGNAVGFAYNALDRKEALLGDSLTELRFRRPDALPADVELSEGFADGATVTFDQLSPTGNGSVLAYVSTEDLSVDSIRTFAEHHPTVEHARPIDSTDGADRFELRFAEPPIISTIASYGGRIRDVTVDGSDLVVVAELPQRADVRSVVAAVQESAPDVELVAQRAVSRGGSEERPLTSTARLDALTEKQQTALEAAHHGGYFEWPRETSGEDIAESLTVSPSTFHQHLRTAERKAFDELLHDD